jgi:hypothetical protein
MGILPVTAVWMMPTNSASGMEQRRGVISSMENKINPRSILKDLFCTSQKKNPFT